MHYCNFDLDLFGYQHIAEAESFRVRVAQSPAGQQKLSDAEIVTFDATLRGHLLRLEQRDLNPGELASLGQQLAGLLFPADIRAYLTRSLERIGEDEGLRIRLLIDNYALAELPWEYACIAVADIPTTEQGQASFLALDRRVSLVRCEVLGESPARLEPVTGPVRLVALLADLKDAGYPPLDLAGEQRSIESALGNNAEFEAAFFTHGTLADLEDALARPCDVFHFAGHGAFVADTSEAPGLQGKGYLVLVGEQGRPEFFPADKLASNLRGHGVRLAVLGACEGGRRDAENAWSGIAPALNRAGIPAVVAMQYTIGDQNAIAFTRRLYTALAAGQPIDAAVADGRLAILNRSAEAESTNEAAEVDWGVPVLYLRADERNEDGILFPRPVTAKTESLLTQFRPGNPGFIALLASASLLVSLLSGINQLAGFFGKISLATAVLSVLMAIAVVIAFPTLLRRQYPKGEHEIKASLHLLVGLLAVVILLAGVGPFAIKYTLARRTASAGQQFVDERDYGPARVRLERAAHYYTDLGLTTQTTDARVTLTQAYAGVGDGDRADALIAELEQSAELREPQQGKLYTIQGNLAQERGQYEQAEHYYQLAQQLVTPNSFDEAALLQNQGALWAGRGAAYSDRVLANYQKAREIYQKLGDERGQAYVLIDEGNLYVNDPPVARSFYEQAKQWAEAAQDSFVTGVSALNVGVTYRKEGNYERAEELYQTAQLQFEAAADLIGQAEVQVNRAVLEWVRGRRELARQYLQQAEAYLANVDVKGGQVNPHQLAVIRTMQADIYDELGEAETAKDLYEKALAIYSEYPEPLAEAKTQFNYGALLLRLGAGEEARNWFGRAREILEAFSGEGPHETLGVLYNGLGEAYKGLGDNDNALKYYRQAEGIFTALDAPLEIAQVQENIGLILGMQGDVAAAVEAIQGALTLYRQVGNADHIVSALFNLYSFTAAADPAIPGMVSEILALLETHNVDQGTEAGVLFGLGISDIGDRSQLMTYRERLLQIKAFYEGHAEPINLGRALIKLAGVEQALGNTTNMVQYAHAAEPYVASIPMPTRISSLTDLGFYLWNDDPQASFDHFLEGFDLSGALGNVAFQTGLATAVQLLVSMNGQNLDRPRCIEKLQAVIAGTQTPDLKEALQVAVDALKAYE